MRLLKRKNVNIDIINFTSSALEYNCLFNFNKKKTLSNRQYLKIKKYIYRNGLTNKWTER